MLKVVFIFLTELVILKAKNMLTNQARNINGSLSEEKFVDYFFLKKYLWAEGNFTIIYPSLFM